VTDIMSDLHFCKHCQQSKPATEMRKDRSYASGYRPQCLDCKAKKEAPKQKRPVTKKRVPFEDRLYSCTKCERNDISFWDMCKDKRKFGGVASTCLDCRRKREAELEARRAQEARDRAREEEELAGLL
jgi:hypothetical protein